MLNPAARVGLAARDTALALAAGCGAAAAGAAIVGLRPGRADVALAVAATVAIPMLVALRTSRFGAGVSTVRFAGSVVALVALVVVTFNGVRVGAYMTVADVFFVGAATAMALALVLEGAPRTLPGWLPAAAAILALSALLSTMFSAAPAANVAPALRFIVSLVFVPAIISWASTSPTRVVAAATAWIVSAALNSVVAASDFFGFTDVGAGVTGERFLGRAAGLATHPNHLAFAAAMALPVALALATTTRNVAKKAASLAIAGTLVMGILVSGSRAGILSGVAGVLLLPLFHRRARRSIVAVVVLGAAFAFALAAYVPAETGVFVGVQRLVAAESVDVSDVAVSNQTRLGLYEEASADFAERPLTGHGFGLVRVAHNIYLQLLQAGGLPALLGFLVFAAGVLHTGWRRARDDALPARVQMVAAAASASMGVWITAGLVQNQIYDRYLYVPAGVILGVNALARARRPAAAGATHTLRAVGGAPP